MIETRATGVLENYNNFLQASNNLLEVMRVDTEQEYEAVIRDVEEVTNAFRDLKNAVNPDAHASAAKTLHSAIQNVKKVLESLKLYIKVANMVKIVKKT